MSFTIYYPGPTWDSTHVYGECLFNPIKQLMFVKIPKCASTWCDNYLARLGQVDTKNTWHGGNFQDPGLSEYRSLVVLRDPIDRWISVMPAREKILALQNESNLITEILDTLCDEQYSTDEHLAPQQDFISGLNLEKTVFFEFGPDLGQNFSMFLQSQGLDHVDTGNFLNLGPADTVKDTWKSLLEHKDISNKIKEIYYKDYKLLGSVKFWTP